MEKIEVIKEYWGIILFFLGLAFHALWTYFKVDDHGKRLEKIESDKQMSDSLISELRTEIKTMSGKLDILVDGFKK